MCPRVTKVKQQIVPKAVDAVEVTSLPIAKDASLDACYGRIREILNSARASLARSVNTTQVVSYWLIGREIVQEEQRGQIRAEYGAHLLVELSKRLTGKFERNYSERNLRYIRRF